MSRAQRDVKRRKGGGGSKIAGIPSMSAATLGNVPKPGDLEVRLGLYEAVDKSLCKVTTIFPLNTALLLLFVANVLISGLFMCD